MYFFTQKYICESKFSTLEKYVIHVCRNKIIIFSTRVTHLDYAYYEKFIKIYSVGHFFSINDIDMRSDTEIYAEILHPPLRSLPLDEIKK